MLAAPEILAKTLFSFLVHREKSQTILYKIFLRYSQFFFSVENSSHSACRDVRRLVGGVHAPFPSETLSARAARGLHFPPCASTRHLSLRALQQF